MALASAALLVLSLAPTAFAVDTSTFRTSTFREIGRVDVGTCQAMIDDLRAHPESVAATDRRAISGLTASDCRMTVDVKGQWNVGFSPAAVAAATSCTYAYQMLHIYVGPIETYTAHIDAYICWSGSTAWQQDYLNCYVSAFPLGFGGSTWCGTINNHTASVSVRNDFYIAAYSNPFWHRPGWMSYDVSGTGAISGVSGFCCS